MNKRYEDVVIRNNQEVRFVWHPNKILDDVLLHQVYGFFVSRDGLVTLVRDKDEKRFTLVGGAIEQDETSEQAMLRECLEEAQFIPNNLKLLGSLEYINPNGDNPMDKHHQEVRFAGEIGDMCLFESCRDGFETEERIFVHYDDLPKYVSWIGKSVTGKEQFKKFKEYFLSLK